MNLRPQSGERHLDRRTIPEPFAKLGSVAFFKKLLEESKLAVSPGLGFGPTGEGFVRFSLIENEERIRQALRGLKSLSS